jgi:o-succinylbenzoate---CoA ligase
MGLPIEILRNRKNWLIGYDSQDLLELTEQRYQEIVQLRDPRVLICDRDPLKFLASFIAACSVPTQIFLCNPDWGDSEWQQVHDLMRPELLWSGILGKKLFQEFQAPIIMIPTGGTSGKIRFAMHTWQTLSASVEGFQQYFECDRINSLCVLPLYHVSGLMQFMRSFLSDGTLAICSWKNLPPENFSNFFLSLVPTQLQKLMATEQVPQCKTILLGGAPAWDSLLERARSLNLPIAPTYGLTETASQIATLKPEEFLQGQTGCGRVLPHAQVKCDRGQIEIQAKSLMLGYYPNFLESPIYRPDDIGFFDEQGVLHISGRNSSKIITGGENVFPAEIEAALLATQLVEDVCVIGLPDEVWGQTIVAIYVSDSTIETLKLALADRMSPFKIPKRWIQIERLPRNAQGKVNYRELELVLARNTVANTSIVPQF